MDDLKKRILEEIELIRVDEIEKWSYVKDEDLKSGQIATIECLTKRIKSVISNMK